MSKDTKIINDATQSVNGTIFQICVALEHAFLLQGGQKMWIEKFGDVTISGQAQIETKQYSDSLTDSHPNFWNTLKNWLLPSFNHSSYQYLTLLTTQPIGAQSKFLDWNDATTTRRLEILKEILAESESRYQESQKAANGKTTASPPKSLMLQRDILDVAKDATLKAIIPKINIASDSPAIKGLRKKIFDVHGKAILRGKSEEFLDDLIGYLISPSSSQNGWEISFDAFGAKVATISARYHSETCIFPTKKIKPTTDQLDLQSQRKFVAKLQEIHYAGVISEAIHDYIFASNTVREELQSYEIPAECYQTYESNLKNAHRTRHRSAKRQVTGNVITASQNFYDDLTGESPQPFPRFQQTPIEFRNGVFHMLADSDTDEFEWKLW